MSSRSETENTIGRALKALRGEGTGGRVFAIIRIPKGTHPSVTRAPVMLLSDPSRPEEPFPHQWNQTAEVCLGCGITVEQYLGGNLDDRCAYATAPLIRHDIKPETGTCRGCKATKEMFDDNLVPELCDPFRPHREYGLMSGETLGDMKCDCPMCETSRAIMQARRKHFCNARIAAEYMGHTLDEVTGNCIACGASREWMTDHPGYECVPDGKPHPRTDSVFDKLQVKVDDLTPEQKATAELIYRDEDMAARHRRYAEAINALLWGARLKSPLEGVLIRPEESEVVRVTVEPDGSVEARFALTREEILDCDHVYEWHHSDLWRPVSQGWETVRGLKGTKLVLERRRIEWPAPLATNGAELRD